MGMSGNGHSSRPEGFESATEFDVLRELSLLLRESQGTVGGQNLEAVLRAEGVDASLQGLLASIDQLIATG